MKGFKCADRPICLVGGKNCKNDGINVRVEEGPIHSTSDTFTYYVVIIVYAVTPLLCRNFSKSLNIESRDTMIRVFMGVPFLLPKPYIVNEKIGISDAWLRLSMMAISLMVDGSRLNFAKSMNGDPEVWLDY